MLTILRAVAADKSENALTLSAIITLVLHLTDYTQKNQSSQQFTQPITHNRLYRTPQVHDSMEIY